VALPGARVTFGGRVALPGGRVTFGGRVALPGARVLFGTPVLFGVSGPTGRHVVNVVVVVLTSTFAPPGTQVVVLVWSCSTVVLQIVVPLATR
jgi:hypothetical protein